MASSRPHVILYSKPTGCQACIATKRRLATTSVVYEERDATVEETAKYLKAKGFLEAPVVAVFFDDQEEWWSGYRPDLIDELAKEFT